MKDEDITTQVKEDVPLSDEQLDDVAGGTGVRLDSYRRKRRIRAKKRAVEQYKEREPGIMWEGGDEFVDDNDYDDDNDY